MLERMESMKEFLRERFQKNEIVSSTLAGKKKRDGQEQVTSLKESVVD